MGTSGMKKSLLLGALFFVGFSIQAQAQYYSYPAPYYDYYPGPVAYNANSYLRATMNNTRRFYNLGSAESYLRGGLANTRYFYGL
jgi:hypothetical protein